MAARQSQLSPGARLVTHVLPITDLEAVHPPGRRVTETRQSATEQHVRIHDTHDLPLGVDSYVLSHSSLDFIITLHFTADNIIYILPTYMRLCKFTKLIKEADQ